MGGDKHKLKIEANISDIVRMVSFSKLYLYLDPFCVPQLRTITAMFLQDPFVATKVAHVTVCCAAATMLIHLEEPTHPGVES